MDAFIALLIDYGNWGMLITAFLAGSVLPFASEAVMVGLLAAGLDPLGLVVYGTVGNTLGGVLNYAIGRMGKTEWISRYLHVSPESLAKAQRFVAGKGAWMGFFGFLPAIGEAITVALGLMRSNFWLTTLAVATGKMLRYVVLIYGASWFF